MTSEFDTRIIKTFTAYHSIYVKGLGHCIWSAMFFLHDLYCGYFRVFVIVHLYAEGEGSADQSASLALPVTQARLKIASSSQVEQKKG